jgi:hypothetical protein
MKHMQAGKARVFVDMWANKDIDGTYCVHRLDSENNHDIAPYTFKDRASAASYIKAHFPNDQVLTIPPYEL